jgi:asparagine synthase (glutamine-hydrolysing)
MCGYGTTRVAEEIFLNPRLRQCIQPNRVPSRVQIKTQGEVALCGFVGGTEPLWNYSAAVESISHRGPDSSRLHLEGPVKVGFRRLSIIDLAETADQPMFARDGASWLVFNGEIYGFKVIRQLLEKRGHVFRTQSDTEVVLNAYLEWGDAFIERLEGMFAIAIWDAGKQELKLFRDRPGIKPLYYFYDGRRFAFSSELKAIEVACESQNLSIDETALYDFLGYRYVPTPKTLFRNCFKLPPAHMLSFNPSTGSVKGPTRYWNIEVPNEPSQRPLEEYCEELRSLVEASVRDQMVADVPVGFFLSGGVDSSVVVAAASGIKEDISTFSIGFDSEAVSETPFAKNIADLFKTNHHERILHKGDAQESLLNFKTWFDEPFADESAIPTFLVSKAAREKVTVVLTGDGGDEVFGGYRTYPRYARYDQFPTAPCFTDSIAHWLRKPFRPRGSTVRILNLIEMALSGGPALWARIMGGMPTADKQAYREQLQIPKDYDDWWYYRNHWREDLPLRTRLQLLDFHTFLPDLVLTKVDRTSMAASLEARVPLLDRRIVEFSFSVPEKIRYYGGELKGMFRHAYRGVLPDHILDRRKKGFGIPRYYLKDLGKGKLIQEHILESLYL